MKGGFPLNAANQVSPVIDQLESALDLGNVPPPYDRWGARLLARLTKPVQVVVTGFDGSGKSALIEMMSAQPVIGQNVRVPVLELAYGKTEQTIVELREGSVRTTAGLLKDCIGVEDAVRVRQELPDTRLIQQDFIEIGLTGDPAQKRACLDAAVARADVLAWCSQDFGEEEQSYWSKVPDHIKDHSILVLTMADRQLMRGVLTETIARLEPIVAEEFLGLFPVATIQGITARTSGQGVNEALWNSSGGKSLMSLVSQQVVQGRNADVDQVRIFMDRLAKRAPRMIASDATGVTIDMPADAQSLPAPANPEFDTTVELVASDAETVAVLSEAADLLQRRATRMLDDMGSSEDLDADAILSGCSDAIMSVKQLLDAADENDPATGAIHEDIQEGEEMLMLFQLESGEDAALDAATLLLQIRQELVDRLAV